jgi:predicted metal-binding protein
MATAYDAGALAAEALAGGFSNAGELNVGALRFMPEVREMCAADKCRQYGRNWTCPPACGSVEEAAGRAGRYSFGMLVQTTARMEDDFDYETIQEAGTRHKGNFRALVAALRGRYPDMLPMSAGACDVCEVCTYPGAPCRHPGEAIPSMEAYGLWVSKVCELSGVPYNYGAGTITYTSCYLLK